LSNKHSECSISTCGIINEKGTICFYSKIAKNKNKISQNLKSLNSPWLHNTYHDLIIPVISFVHIMYIMQSNISCLFVIYSH